MARLRLSFGLLVVMLVACESAPQSKPQDGSGELPSEDRKSLESEGFLPRRRFGDPPLISGLPKGGFNPLPDGAPWMSESGDPVFPAYDDDDYDHKERKKEEDVGDNEIPKPVDDDDKPGKKHRGHKPASDDHDEEEPNSLDGIKPDKDIPDEEDDDDHSNDEGDRHKVDFEEPKFEDDEAEEDSKGEEDADEESKDEDVEDDEAEEGSKGGEDGDEESEDEDDGDSEEAPPFGSFMFDTPFFNVRQVSKYFQHLEKALEQVFRQTLDEATLLNGTYANTTEEEVEIDGKKFVVQKSVIQGKDNNSSIYVEALSALPKGNNSNKAVKGSGL